jgi:hypothetical protein
MPLDPVTGVLTAGTIVGGVLQSAAQQRANAESLAFQKWLANEELRMGQASRTDAMGNTVRYDKALNQWVTDLSPTQRALSKAGEHEQLLGLTDDAAKSRVIRERAFNRGMGANDDFTRARADYNYGYNPSEGAVTNDIADLILRSRSGRVGDDGPNKFLRQRGNLPVINTGAGNTGGVSGVADALLQARSAGLGERGQRQQQRQAKLPEMQSLAAMSDAGGGSPVQFPNFNNLFASEGDQSKQLLGAAEAGGKGVGSAYSNIAKQKPIFDMGDTARLISALRGAPVSSRAKAPDPIASSTSLDDRSLDDIMYNF